MQKGFTLIETLIYIALFAIIIGGGMIATYQIIQSTDSGNNHVIMEEEANFLLRKINWALTGDVSITSVVSNKLVVSKSIAGTPATLTFTYSSPNLTLKRSGSSITLNSASISVKSFSFAATPTGTGITTTFTLETLQNGRKVTEDFSTTKYLRK